MAEVHLIYTGIVGLVPVNGRVTVVVQDARNTEHLAHIPHVVIEANAYVSSRNLPDLGSHGVLRGFLLEHYDVMVTGSQATDFSMDPNFILVLASGCPGSAPGCGGFNRALLDDPIPDSVAARMQLPNGRLETTFVHPRQQWHFEGLAGGPVHLAEEICHRFRINGEILTLTFSETAELRVKVPPGQSTIEVRFGNLPLSLIFEPPPDPKPVDDHHVKLYYRLSQHEPDDPRPLIYSPAPTPLPNPPQMTHLPYRPHRLTPPEQHVVRGPNCPPALWW